MSFTHFLITRVNIGYVTRIKAQNHKEEEWLDHRFNLFFNTCLTSVLNQESRNFIWLIYLDIRTPLSYVQQLRDRIEDYPHIEVLTKEGGFDDIRYHLSADISKRIDSETEFLITSRIDSDDLIHKNFIQEVQHHFDYQEYMSINFNFGWVYDRKMKVLGKAKNMSNPFISLIEKTNSNKPIKTVFWQSHTDFISERDRLEINNDERLWCMNIHQVNDSTKFFGLPVFWVPAKLMDNFGFNFVVTSDVRVKLHVLLKYYKRQSKKVIKYLLSFLSKYK